VISKANGNERRGRKGEMIETCAETEGTLGNCGERQSEMAPQEVQTWATFVWQDKFASAVSSISKLIAGSLVCTKPPASCSFSSNCTSRGAELGQACTKEHTAVPVALDSRVALESGVQLGRGNELKRQAGSVNLTTL
jgi:hypothetical protein